MRMEKRPFGTTSDGRNVSLYTLTNAAGASVVLTDFGARVVDIRVPDQNGVIENVTLGYDEVAAYETVGKYFGATIGRCANRLNGAAFTFNGKRYALVDNDDGRTLHGGANGFHAQVFSVQPVDNGIAFSRVSADGEEGFPGEIALTVTMTFSQENVLRIEYRATAKDDTLVSLTNHTYFNLSGNGANTILDHRLQVFSDFMTPLTENMVASGEIRPTAGTPFDFTVPCRVGARIDSGDAQLAIPGGYDHNFVLRQTERDVLCHAANLWEDVSGRRMETWTTMPGMQLYSGNFLKPHVGKDDVVYDYRTGLCLETQLFPNAMECTHFPSILVRAGQTQTSVTEYRFFAEKTI